MNSSDAVFFLREGVYLEPLIHKWYAWPYLIPPVTAAMNLTGRNLRLMKSFVANAPLHIRANSTPGLAGGDFVNCTEAQIDEVRALIEDLESRHRDYFQIREAVTTLNALLEQQNGLSMESLYEQVPEALRGYVELVYDMQHHASFRLIEGLLYQGSLYKPEQQSISLGSLSAVRERPFVLSSPRLPDTNHLHVTACFADPWVDELARLRTVPAPRREIEDLFARVPCSERLPFDAFFTQLPPRRIHERVHLGLKVTYLGHAGLMLETPSLCVLVDPVIPSRDGVHDDQIVSFSELPSAIDYVCVTHTHMDHTCIETLLQLRHRVGTVLVPKNSGGELADPSLKLMLRQLGFRVREFEDMETLECADGRIMAVPFLGEHADLRIRSKTGWYFELQNRKVLAAADTASLDQALSRRIHQSTGNLDMLFVGMECVGAPMSWLYGALFTKPVPREINESRRFNGSDCKSAWKLIEAFNPSRVGIYALGMEPWFRYFMGIAYEEGARQIVESDRLLQLCAERQLPAQRLTTRQVWNFA
jgi:L-ascorbate metabolism protein UlaG (beta-lactamase superfamily)